MTENINNYPSCIKIPNSKQDHKIIHQTKENLTLVMQQKKIIHANNVLLSIATEIFGKEWSHSVTNQTLDFVDFVKNFYVVGCCTFVKIQLSSGVFHEDVGYSTKEGSTKGEAIHCARLASYNDALTKVLFSFGGKVKLEVEKCIENSFESLPISRISSPISHDTKEIKEKKELSPTNKGNSFYPVPQILKSNIENVPSNTVTGTRDQIANKSNICTDQEENNDKKLSMEEMLRLERKRKQMEKQMEYKRLMREKELKKNNTERKE